MLRRRLERALFINIWTNRPERRQRTVSGRNSAAPSSLNKTFRVLCAHYAQRTHDSSSCHKLLKWLRCSVLTRVSFSHRLWGEQEAVLLNQGVMEAVHLPVHCRQGGGCYPMQRILATKRWVGLFEWSRMCDAREYFVPLVAKEAPRRLPVRYWSSKLKPHGAESHHISSEVSPSDVRRRRALKRGANPGPGGVVSAVP